MFRKACLVIALALFLPGLAAAADTDAAEAKERAVERYFELAPIAQMLEELMPQVASQFPGDQREDMEKALLENMNVKGLESVAKSRLRNHLTLEELNAFITFMEQPAGRSALGKMKYYMSDLMPVIEDEIRRAYRLIQSKGQ